MKSEQGFEQYYQEIYGERWPALKSALLTDKKFVAVKNPFHSNHVTLNDLSELNWYPNAFEMASRQEVSGEDWYFLDAASLLPIWALDITPGDHILDMCAAPGGKSLMMCFGLNGEGSLTANDRSPDRRGRMRRLLESFVPEANRPQWRITGHDASAWGLHEKNVYDKVLLDAPCSSERHVLEDTKELAQWSLKRPKRLATEQFAMLCSALEAVKVGGRVVYSTCALNPEENDGVMAKLFKKRAGRFKLEKLNFPLGEATEFGQRVLPDRDQHGPFYVAVITKEN